MPYVYHFDFLYVTVRLFSGGACIQEECTRYVKRNGPLRPGKVFISGAGKLPCTKVVHTVGPRWEGGSKYGTVGVYNRLLTFQMIEHCFSTQNNLTHTP